MKLYMRLWLGGGVDPILYVFIYIYIMYCFVLFKLSYMASYKLQNSGQNKKRRLLKMRTLKKIAAV